jgi:leucyl aminopeptidase
MEIKLSHPARDRLGRAMRPAPQPPFPDLLQPDRGQPAIALHFTDKSGFEDWLKGQPSGARGVKAQGFKGEAFQLAIVPGASGTDGRRCSASPTGEPGRMVPRQGGRGAAGRHLPPGEGRPGPAALGWLLGQYRFDRFKQEPKAKGPRVLLTSEPARIEEAVRLAQATALVRDLVNLPAGDLGPAELQAAAEAVAVQAA